MRVKVMFITIMQRYSGQREIEMELTSDPAGAVEQITERLAIPWKDNLEKSTRIFINGENFESFVKSGRSLSPNDTIAFIPISSGG